MARTESSMLPLATQVPQFQLREVRDGSLRASRELMGAKGLLVMFICAHCPFVQHVEHELARLGIDYRESGIGIVAISSNDAESYPDDAPPGLARQAERLGFVFPYLHDETQEVARAFKAACTPDFFLFDQSGELFYRGQLDSSRPANGVSITGGDLRAAMNALIAGGPVPEGQRPSLGCNIKWRV